MGLEGKWCICEMCGIEYEYRPNTNHLALCSTCRLKRSLRRVKINFLNERGYRCEDCGLEGSGAALDFYHRSDLRHKPKWNVSQQKIRTELENYVLLCRNCQAERIYGVEYGADKEYLC